MGRHTQKSYRPVPGLDRKAEEAQLSEIIGIAQANLEKTEQSGAKLSEELHELMETYGTKDKEALSLFHNTQSQLRENQRDLIRCQKRGESRISEGLISGIRSFPAQNPTMWGASVFPETVPIPLS